MKNIIFIIIILISVKGFSQKKVETFYDENRTFSPAQMQEDVAFLKRCIEEGHPSTFRYISKDSFDLAYENFSKSLTKPMTEREFRNAFFATTNSIKCGHSSLFNSIAREKYLAKKTINYLPFTSLVVDNHLFINENKSKHNALAQGTEVLSIEGILSKECIEKLAASISEDGYNTTHSATYLQTGFCSYYPRLFAEKDSFNIVLKNENGNIRPLKVASFEIGRAHV